MRMKDFLTLDDFDFENKTVLLRVDINSPVDEKTKKITNTERIKECTETIKELSEKNAKVVVLAHQGRKGDYDFVSLKEHAKILGNLLDKEVAYVDDVYGKLALQKIKSMKVGEIILLKNVRNLDEETKDLPVEEHAKTNFVKTLSSVADFFVNDAFSAAHRSHASLVGFTKILPSVSGRVMEWELTNVQKILKEPKKPVIFVFGGVKIDDCLGIMKHALEKDMVDKVLTSGTLGEILLTAKKINLGKETMNFLEKSKHLDFLEDAKNLIDAYQEKIETPIDFAIEENGKRKEISLNNLPSEKIIMDIGTKTVEKYAKIIKEAKTIVVKGPAGAYENPNFSVGTKLIFSAIKDSGAFSLAGGGHTISAIDELKIDKSKFSHVSTAGGAFINYLSGKKLPAVEALKDAVKNKNM